MHRQATSAVKLNFDKIERFMRYIDRADVLQRILAVPERDRPTEAARLYTHSHPSDAITTTQARYIGDHYFWFNGNICKLTPEIKARLN